MRLAKYLAHAGVASRRSAEKLIAEGRVSLDGETVTDPARSVTEGSPVAVDGRALEGAERRVVYAVNKPAGVVSTAKDTHGRRTVVELVPARELRLYPVGRLDANSSGLILLTNDGELANGLIHPRYQIPKTYRARVRDRVGERALRALREGVQLEDGPTAPARVRLVLADRRSESLIELTIREGRNRQVRRMCAAVGHPVLALERIAFGPVGLDGLPSGSHRLLSNAEIDRLRSAGRRDGDVPNLHAEDAAGRPQEEAVGRVAGRLTAPSLTSASRRRARSCERGSVRPGAETPPAVPTIKTERLASDGPFHVGERYEVVPDGSTEHFPGVIVEVRPTGPKHLEITVELSDAEYERLLATE